MIMSFLQKELMGGNEEKIPDFDKNAIKIQGKEMKFP